jgi:hypothetical protein
VPPIWRLLKDSKKLREMQALAAAYTGPITHCPPGVARAHEPKPSYELPRRSAGTECDHPDDEGRSPRSGVESPTVVPSPGQPSPPRPNILPVEAGISRQDSIR